MCDVSRLPRQDEHVDLAYQRQEAVASIAEAHRRSSSVDKSGEHILIPELVAQAQGGRTLQSVGLSVIPKVVTGAIAGLVADFPENLTFEPDIENEPVHLRKLPDELLVVILRKLDPTSIERFATVSRKARLIALESSIWRYA